MLRGVHALSAGGYTDAFDGITTSQRSDIRRSADVFFSWAYWNRLEPQPGAHQLDVFARNFQEIAAANEDGLKVALVYVNPYPLSAGNHSNADWTAGDPAKGIPLDLSRSGPWARHVGLMLLCLNGLMTWGQVRKCAAWDPASAKRAEAFGIADTATARAHYAIPWGEMNASNPANGQQPGVVDPRYQAQLMIAYADITAGLAHGRYQPAMPLGPALLDGPPHNTSWGRGTNLIPCGTTMTQYTDDSYNPRKKITRDSTCDPRANNHIVPGFTWDQYALQLLGHLQGWKPPVPFGWAHHAYSDLSSGPEWKRSTTEGLTRLLAKHRWPDVRLSKHGRRGRVWLTEEAFQAWNDQGVIRGRPGVYDLQLQHLQQHYDACRQSGDVMLWTQYLMFTSARFPADGTIGWLGVEELNASSVVKRPAYAWWTARKP